MKAIKLLGLLAVVGAAAYIVRELGWQTEAAWIAAFIAIAHIGQIWDDRYSDSVAKLDDMQRRLDEIQGAIDTVERQNGAIIRRMDHPEEFRERQ